VRRCHASREGDVGHGGVDCIEWSTELEVGGLHGGEEWVPSREETCLKEEVPEDVKWDESRGSADVVRHGRFEEEIVLSGVETRAIGSRVVARVVEVVGRQLTCYLRTFKQIHQQHYHDGEQCHLHRHLEPTSVRLEATDVNVICDNLVLGSHIKTTE